MILLSHGERIYYDGRLVVSTEGPGSLQRWFSQRVGWYHGLIKVYTERFSEVLRISRRSPFAAYHYLIYVGGLSLAMHLVKIVSAALLLLSFLGGLDALLLDDYRAAGKPHQSRVLHRGDQQLSCARSDRALHQRAEGGTRLYGAHRPAVPVLRDRAHRADDGGLRQFLCAQAVSTPHLSGSLRKPRGSEYRCRKRRG